MQPSRWKSQDANTLSPDPKALSPSDSHWPRVCLTSALLNGGPTFAEPLAISALEG